MMEQELPANPCKLGVYRICSVWNMVHHSFPPTNYESVHDQQLAWDASNVHCEGGIQDSNNLSKSVAPRRG